MATPQILILGAIMSNKIKFLTVRFPVDVFKKLRELAQENQRATSEMVRVIVTDKIKEEK
jgi:predicted transcriptional regulator